MMSSSSSSFKPMLSGKAPDDLSKVRFPVMASPKLDGIRCLIVDGKAVTRSLKPIPNDFIRNWLEAHAPEGCDGEITLQHDRAPFSEVSSAVMKKTGEPDFTYWVFDTCRSPFSDYPFATRVEIAFSSIVDNEALQSLPDYERVLHLEHCTVRNVEELLAVHAELMQLGYEGTMIRSLDGPYKHGRSTEKEGYLLKIKNFEDEEATVVGFEERMHNENELEQDNLGHAKRSSSKAGLVPAGTLGALMLRFADGTLFSCGTGFCESDRSEIWNSRQEFIGKAAKIKHQPDPGGRKPGRAPRFPVFVGWRLD